MTWDRLLLVLIYYDGPRVGISTFRGTYYKYQSEWNDVDNTKERPRYRLAEAVIDDVAAALELNAIFRRWKAAADRDVSLQHHHPAMPHERQRYIELWSLLDSRLMINNIPFVLAEAEFRPMTQGANDPHWLGEETLVYWKVLAPS